MNLISKTTFENMCCDALVQIFTREVGGWETMLQKD